MEAGEVGWFFQAADDDVVFGELDGGVALFDLLDVAELGVANEW